MNENTSEYRIAIVGAGPAGFFAADKLLKNLNQVKIDLFERLPRPYGLVEYGIAPDHDKLKMAMKLQFNRILQDKNTRFFGNVSIGKELSIQTLRDHYHAVLITTGQQSTKKLGIPGEDLEGVYTGKNLVSYSNYSPDYAHWNFRVGARVAVIGNGNVAMDVARFLVKGRVKLKGQRGAFQREATAELDQVKKIIVAGRRGLLQAKFTNREIHEIGGLENASLYVDQKYIQLDELNQDLLNEGNVERDARKNMSYMGSLESVKDEKIQIEFRFLVSPVEFLGSGGKLKAIKFEKNRLEKKGDRIVARGRGVFIEEPMDAVFMTIGDFGIPIEGLPFDEGIIPSVDYHVLGPDGLLSDVFVGGWIRTGPRGVLGQTKQEAMKLANKVTQTLVQSQWKAKKDVISVFDERKLVYVTYQDYLRLENEEKEQGKERGLEQLKMTSIKEMLDFIQLS